MATKLEPDAVGRPALDLLGRVVAIVVLSVVILVVFPLLIAHAG